MGAALPILRPGAPQTFGASQETPPRCAAQDQVPLGGTPWTRSPSGTPRQGSPSGHPGDVVTTGHPKAGSPSGHPGDAFPIRVVPLSPGVLRPTSAGLGHGGVWAQQPPVVPSSDCQEGTLRGRWLLSSGFAGLTPAGSRKGGSVCPLGGTRRGFRTPKPYPWVLPGHHSVLPALHLASLILSPQTVPIVTEQDANAARLGAQCSARTHGKGFSFLPKPALLSSPFSEPHRRLAHACPLWVLDAPHSLAGTPSTSTNALVQRQGELNKLKCGGVTLCRGGGQEGSGVWDPARLCRATGC